MTNLANILVSCVSIKAKNVTLAAIQQHVSMETNIVNVYTQISNNLDLQF